MGLFGNNRDVSLVKRFNRELLNEIIDTRILYYKLVLSETKENVYNESKVKVYYTPLTLICQISREDPQFQSNEVVQDYTVMTRFAFLRESLVELDVVLEVGDIFEWDNEYYEVDAVIENKYFVNKNPNTNISNQQFGTSLSIICDAHVTHRDKLELIDSNRGIN